MASAPAARPAMTSDASSPPAGAEDEAPVGLEWTPDSPQADASLSSPPPPLPPRPGAELQAPPPLNAAAAAAAAAASSSSDKLAGSDSGGVGGGSGGASRSSSGRWAAVPLGSRKVLAGSLPHWKAAGRRNLDLTVVQTTTWLCQLRNAYNRVLKLKAGEFALLVLASPIALALVFTPFFLLFASGFDFKNARDFERIMATAQGDDGEGGGGGVYGDVGASFFRTCQYSWTVLVHVFIFALSLCTSFGGSPLAAVSPPLVVLSNLCTLSAQLLFVFVSGAVFAKIARPADSVRAASKIIIAHQTVTGHGEEKRRVLLARMAIVGINSHELVSVTMTITFRIFLVTPSGSIFCQTETLPLVRSEIALLRFGFVARHVIDESSPLNDFSDDDLRLGDASFSFTVSGMEKLSMHPIFYKKDYFVYDGDVVYDREFADMLILAKGRDPVFDHSRLDWLKPLPPPAAANVS